MNVIFILILMSVIVSNEGPSERLMCQIFQKQLDEGSIHDMFSTDSSYVENFRF